MKSWDIIQSGWTSKHYVKWKTQTCALCGIGMWVGHRRGEHFERGAGYTEREGGHTERDHTVRIKWKAQKTCLPSREHCLPQVNLKALFCDFILFCDPHIRAALYKIPKPPIIIVGIKIIINWWLLPETSLVSIAAYKLGAAGGNQVIQHL